MVLLAKLKDSQTTNTLNWKIHLPKTVEKDGRFKFVEAIQSLIPDIFEFRECFGAKKGVLGLLREPFFCY